MIYHKWPVNVHSVGCSTTKKATKAVIETFDTAVFILGIMRTDDKHSPLPNLKWIVIHKNYAILPAGGITTCWNRHTTHFTVSHGNVSKITERPNLFAALLMCACNFLFTSSWWHDSYGLLIFRVSFIQSFYFFFFYFNCLHLAPSPASSLVTPILCMSSCTTFLNVLHATLFILF